MGSFQTQSRTHPLYKFSNLRVSDTKVCFEVLLCNITYHTSGWNCGSYRRREILPDSGAVPADRVRRGQYCYRWSENLWYGAPWSQVQTHHSTTGMNFNFLLYTEVNRGVARLKKIVRRMRHEVSCGGERSVGDVLLSSLWNFIKLYFRIVQILHEISMYSDKF